MAAVAAGPVFRLLGTKDLGTTDDYRTEKMPAVNVRMLGGQLAWRQHDGGHTDDGKLFEGMMGDQLHPTVKGYQVWADGLRPIFEELLGLQAKVDHAPAATGDPKVGE
jgi:lysophospholipase L1-like esterase